MDPHRNLREYGETLIDSVDPARAEVVAVRALTATSAGLSLRRRLVAIAAATATFITGNVGMVMAADPAVPGDLLYGLDRAYERLSDLVGLTDDHSDERLEEAAQLAAAGNSSAALGAVIAQIQDLRGDAAPESDDLELAVDAVTEARERAVEAPENETAAEATEQAKTIVSIAHQIAEAVQAGDREKVRDLIEELRAAAQANGLAKGREQNNGVGPPDEPGDRGNGGDRGNSSNAPGQQP